MGSVHGAVEVNKEVQCYCVRGTRTQPLISVGCSVHYWVSCAINNRAFLRLHLCRHTFASLWGACLRFALLWHTIRVSSEFIFHMFAEVKLRCEALRRHFIMTCDIFSTGQTNILGLCYLFGKTFKQPSKAPVKSLKSTHSTKLLHLLRWTIQ